MLLQHHPALTLLRPCHRCHHYLQGTLPSRLPIILRCRLRRLVSRTPRHLHLQVWVCRGMVLMDLVGIAITIIIITEARCEAAEGGILKRAVPAANDRTPARRLHLHRPLAAAPRPRLMMMMHCPSARSPNTTSSIIVNFLWLSHILSNGSGVRRILPRRRMLRRRRRSSRPPRRAVQTRPCRMIRLAWTRPPYASK